MRTRAYEIHKELVERDGYAGPLTIKEYLQGKHISQKMFYATFAEHNERMAQLVGIEFDAVTLSRYRLCLRYFKEMMSRKTKVADLPIKNLNGEMIRDFEAFLKIEKRVAQNTMISYMMCLKKVVNLAIANGWITVNPFAGIKFSEKKVVKDFLTIEEVNTIRTKELIWCVISLSFAAIRDWRLLMSIIYAQNILQKMHTAVSGFTNNARRPRLSSLCLC